jgi:hypothetical protein
VAFGESRWVRHALIVFAAYTALSLALIVVGLANGGLGLHLPPQLRSVMVGLTASVGLAAHLVNATPTRARRRDDRPLDRFLAEAVELPARADARRVFVEREDPSPAAED